MKDKEAYTNHKLYCFETTYQLTKNNIGIIYIVSHFNW